MIRQLSLIKKVLLLMVFMFMVTVATFLWFTNKIMNHNRQSQSSLEQEFKALKDQHLQELKEKTTNLQESIHSNLQSMEKNFHNMQENEERFNEDFLEEQN